MLKPFNTFDVEVHASVDTGVQAQLLFDQDRQFVGRIDFYSGQSLPSSYLWHPNGPGDESQTYLVLAMPIDRFDAILEILDDLEELALELWPVGPMFGASTDGYGGVLRSTGSEPVGEERRMFVLSRRPM